MTGCGTYRFIYADSGFLETRTGGPWHFIFIATRNMCPACLAIITGMEPRKRLLTLLRVTLTNKVGDRTHVKLVEDIVDFADKEIMKAQADKPGDILKE